MNESMELGLYSTKNHSRLQFPNEQYKPAAIMGGIYLSALIGPNVDFGKRWHYCLQRRVMNDKILAQHNFPLFHCIFAKSNLRYFRTRVSFSPPQTDLGNAAHFRALDSNYPTIDNFTSETVSRRIFKPITVGCCDVDDQRITFVFIIHFR